MERTRHVKRQLTQPEPYDWKGDDAVWERLLGDALGERGLVDWQSQS